MKAKEIYVYVLAALFLLGFFILSWMLRNTPENSYMLGVVETLKNGVILILGYFFGSSKGSSDKTEIIKNQKNEQA